MTMIEVKIQSPETIEIRIATDAYKSAAN